MLLVDFAELPPTELIGSMARFFPISTWCFLIPFPLYLSSCVESENTEASTFLVRDSVGIEIVENPEALVREPPRFQLDEDLRIGAVAGRPEEEFGFLADLAVSAGGEIFVLDSGSHLVRVFAFDGAPLRVFGGRGEGPGESQNEGLRIAIVGDSVVVQDRFRFHVFTLEGEHLGTAVQRITGYWAPPVFTRGQETWLVGLAEFSPPPSDHQRTTVDTFRVFPVNLSEGTKGPPIIEEPSTLRRYWPDLGRSVSQWYGHTVEAAVRPNGEIYLVNGSDYEIRIFSAKGEVVKRIRAAEDRTPLSDAEFDAVLADGESWFGEKQVRELGYPEFRPISGRLLVAPSGGFLMKRMDLSSSPRMPDAEVWEVWDLFDPDGKISGRLTTDGSVNLRVMTDEFVYGILRDEFDVCYAVRYRLAPGEG